VSEELNASADLHDWDRIAARYAARVSTPEDRVNRVLGPALWESIGEVRGRRVLDLGCGNGWLSARLAALGAEVTGVDGSAALLAAARTTHPGIAFLRHDLTAGLPPLEERFDLAVSHMVLMDLPEIAPVLAAVRAVLVDGGRLVLTLPHPCFFNHRSRWDEESGWMARMVTGYLTPAVWRIETFGGHNHYHRSLTYYLDHLRAAGFAVTRLHEPPQQPDPATPHAAFYRDIPVFMLIEAVARPL
jgi:SAM-dependent methyltransferase